MSNTAVLAVKIISDAKGAQRGMDQTAGKASRMAKAGSIAGKALAVGLGAAAFAAVKATKAAADDEAAQVKLANTMRNAAGASSQQIAATERWITAQGKAKGVADDELRPALGRLVAVTHDVGKAQKLANLGMDIAAGTGKSLETVTSALAKAQAGSLGGLSRLGVATKDAAGNTRSLKDITAELGKTYAGAATKQAQTAAGKQKILTVQMGELQEQIGAKLLPVMLKLADVGLKVVGWISRNSDLALALVGSLGALLAIVKVVSVATQVWTAVTKVWTAVTVIARNAQLAWNLAMMANPIGLVVVAVVALVAVIILLWKRSETFRRIVIGVWNAIKKATSAVWNGIKKLLLAVWKFLVAAVKSYFTTYRKVITVVWNAIKKATSTVWNGIKGVLKAVWTFIVGLVRGQINRARAVIVAVWTVIKSATGRAWDGVKRVVSSAIGAVLRFVLNMKSRVIGVFQNAGRWLLDAGRRIIQGLIDGITNMFGKVRDVLGNLTSKLTSWKGPASVDNQLLTPAGERIIDSLIGGFRRRESKVKSYLQSVTRTIAGSIDSDPFATSTSSGSLALAARAGGANVYQVTVQGALDPVAVGDQIDGLLKSRARRLGKR
jgi:phage-related protein